MVVIVVCDGVVERPQPPGCQGLVVGLDEVVDQPQSPGCQMLSVLTRR